MKYSEIDFGRASAEAESSDSPRLLIEGYLDSYGYTSRALQSASFIFLGYKGSGKTALGKHLALKAASDPMLFVQTHFLSDFPYRSFAKIIAGDGELESKLPTAWSWLLLIMVLDSFMADHAKEQGDNLDFDTTTSGLKKAGLLPAQSLKDIVVQSSKRKFRFALPNVMEIDFSENTISNEEMRFLHIVEHMKRLVAAFRSESRHYIVLDGLDDVLSQRDVQYQSLSALIVEAQRLNALFRESCVPAKIIVLCRTDLFERLPGPNKNKIRQDYAIEFDWYHDPRQPERSELFALANLRAKLADPSINDVFSKYFPAKIREGKTMSFLLDHTRHTPRDFIQLLVHLKKFYRDKKFNREAILSGLRDYSLNYFLPEIRDELGGYMDMRSIDQVIKGIQTLGKTQFSYFELVGHLGERAADVNIDDALEILFECSAIGHVEDRAQKGLFYSLKFRNRHLSFSRDKKIVLHKGLWKALNLI